MTSTEWVTLIERWLNSTSGQLTLHIDDGEVLLARHPNGIGAAAAINLPYRIDERELYTALRYSCAAVLRLGREAASLSLSADGQLWLLTRHEPDDPVRLCQTLEALVNQRDAWQGLLAPATRSVSSLPRNLKTLAFLQGDQHA
ncbi:MULTISPECIES: type III secretion system chaperone [Dickeya]|uniref:Type III secretion protein HrpG n=1 Tax=Dickeya aquatica TaxID=1401087 RepID=A0A375AAX1_9GAMM|nr:MULTISPECIES: type III secretion system chaperone [Dickeya]SLM63262.1 type III secretion protein HrpG [Dickeya aquatica]